jgi:ubiquinone/menaquinone biosynthesis C-methylase UbiE
MSQGAKDRDRSRLNRRQSRYFDQAVELFDREQPPHILRRLKEIVVAARVREGESVLDVGAGVGVLVPFLRERKAGRILACELSRRMLSRLKQNHPDVETHLGDVSDLLLPEASLDVVFMNAVFPNLMDKTAALSNCSRMLRVGGRLVISHPEGRRFVECLREIVPFPLDSLPLFPQLRKMLTSFPLRIQRYRDHENLYFAVLQRVKGSVSSAPPGLGEPGSS